MLSVPGPLPRRGLRLTSAVGQDAAHPRITIPGYNANVNSMEVRMARWREIGGSNVGCIIGFVVLLLVVFIGIKVVPTRIAVAELQDFCEKQAEQASLPRFTNERITDAILEKAQEARLPVKKADIKVDRNTQRIDILVKYHVILDLVVYQYDWAVEHKVDRTLF